jgi:hypothetical protein
LAGNHKTEPVQSFNQQSKLQSWAIVGLGLTGQGAMKLTKLDQREKEAFERLILPFEPPYKRILYRASQTLGWLLGFLTRLALFVGIAWMIIVAFGYLNK